MIFIKNNRFFILIVVCILFLIGSFIFFCFIKNNTTKITNEQREQLVFGIVKTTNFTKKTTILGYDEDLNLIVDKKYPFTNVGHFANQTVFDTNFYYGQVAGNEKFRDGKEVLEIDLNDLSYKTYELEKNGLFNISNSKDYIFGTVNWNGISYITSINKANGKKYN